MEIDRKYKSINHQGSRIHSLESAFAEDLLILKEKNEF